MDGENRTGSERQAVKGLRVGVVDNLPIVRAGVSYILSVSGVVQKSIECATAADALRLAQDGSIDIILIDPFTLPGGAQNIPPLGRFPGAQLMIISTVSDANSVGFALRNGARAYILKTASPGELVRAVGEVARGHSYVTPRLPRSCLPIANP